MTAGGRRDGGAQVSRRLAHIQPGLPSRNCRFVSYPSCFAQLLFDPRIGLLETGTQSHGRLPTEDLSETAIVAVPSAYSLRPRQVVTLAQVFARNFAYQIYEVVDRNQLVCTEIESIVVIGGHDAHQAFYAIIHVHERARLLTVAPDLNVIAVFRERHFPANGRRSFLFAPVVGSQASIDIVETHDARFELIVMPVITAHLLCVEFFPAVTRLRFSWKRILLS